MDSPLDVIGMQIDLMRDDLTRKQVEITAAEDHLTALITNRDELNAGLDEWAKARQTLSPAPIYAPARLLAAKV